MFKKFLAILVVLVTSFAFTGCLNSLVFDQKKGDNNSFENKLDGFKKRFSMQGQKKEYETNRIFSNDFPVTYRAKLKKTF
jgi:hypothetical protein